MDTDVDCPADCPDCYERRVNEFGIPVLDHGLVRVEATTLSDEMVIRAAKVSFAKDDLTDVNFERFISFLMSNKHGTPFEHGSVTMQVKLPIFVVREWQRHRVGHSYNEQSGRYSVLAPEFYVPSFVRHQTGKPGSYTFEPVDSASDLYKTTRACILAQSQHAYEMYELMLKDGIAKEQARLVLPVNTYTSMYWTCNARSLMHWLALRSGKDAMFEIREYARVVEEIFDWLMPVTARAFREAGRVAP